MACWFAIQAQQNARKRIEGVGPENGNSPAPPVLRGNSVNDGSPSVSECKELIQDSLPKASAKEFSDVLPWYWFVSYD